MTIINMILAYIVLFSGCCFSQTQKDSVTFSPIPFRGKYVLEKFISTPNTSEFSQEKIGKLMGQRIEFTDSTLRFDTILTEISSIEVERFTDEQFYGQNWGNMNTPLHFEDIGYEGNVRYLYQFWISSRERVLGFVPGILYFDNDNIILDYGFAYFKLKKIGE